MIVGKRKPLDEIAAVIADYQRVLTLGCGGCTAVCLASGPREVEALNIGLKKHVGAGPSARIKSLGSYTIERQCEKDFIAPIDDEVAHWDALLSMACGAGVQLVSERYPDMPVFPAINTVFLGINKDVGWYEERCRSCGDCQLAYTGGTCPITRCAKGLFNGPCGGTRRGGRCEVNAETPCAWVDIIARLKRQARLASIAEIRAPMDWKNQVQGTCIQDEYTHRYVKP
ncbi:MAG: methylenetetrahydrofolate reductase C-terminal domain-containing protein [Myxococcota bacterium]|nr:methylenetetrahydrofolate reductase C-terminal domain-containing protein [Myxococcota bacterium]